MRFIVTGDTLAACQKAGLKVGEVELKDAVGEVEKWSSITVEKLSELKPVLDQFDFRDRHNFMIDFRDFNSFYDVDFTQPSDDIPCRLRLHYPGYCDSDDS